MYKKKNYKHGQRVSCKINGVFTDDAKISVDKQGDMVVCHNISIINGGYKGEYFGYNACSLLFETFEKKNEIFPSVIELKILDTTTKTTEREDKLKLFKNEVVHCETPLLDFMVRELADKLGEKLRTKESYIKTSYWEIYKENMCLDVYGGGYEEKRDYEENRRITISAEEWLNRHEVFIQGQKVYYSNESKEHAEISVGVFLLNGFVATSRNSKGK